MGGWQEGPLRGQSPLPQKNARHVLFVGAGRAAEPSAREEASCSNTHLAPFLVTATAAQALKPGVDQRAGFRLRKVRSQQ